jgi:hypothetical protein
MPAYLSTAGNANARDPASEGAAVTPSDTVDLAKVTTALYIGGAGAVSVTMVGGQHITFAAVPVGTYLPIRVSRVWSTGTAATNILALWREN